jgi:Zn-dependent protease/CBS domain-containing protein
VSKESAPRLRTALFIGRYFGIEFYLDASWLLIAALVAVTLSHEVFPPVLPHRTSAIYYALGLITAALFFLSILLHELGHSLVSQRCGIPVPRITLLFIGGLAEISREPDDAKSELKIALAGPAVSVFLSGLFKLLSMGGDALGWEAFARICEWLSITNLLLVIFNMIPGYPLDGGRVLRALLWAKYKRLWRATYISTRIGIGFSWVLMLFGIFALVELRQWQGVLFIIMGIFLKSAAESGYNNALQREILAGVYVKDIMTANPASIPDSMPLNLVVDEFFLAGHHVAYPVCTPDGDFRGLMRLDLLKGVSREKWPYVSAGDCVAEDNSESLGIGPLESAGRAMRLLLAPELSRLAVVENGKLLGIVTRHDILHFIEMHTTLEK